MKLRRAMIGALVIGLGACHSEAVETSGTESGDFVISNPIAGQTAQLKPGQTLVLRLNANHTTGYSWQLVKFDGDALDSAAPAYETDQHAPGVAGSGGTEVWRFTALKTGHQSIRLEYRRPWEAPGMTPGQVSTLDVEVQ